MDKITSFSRHLCCCPVSSWTGSYVGKDGSYTWAQQHELPFTKAIPTTTTIEYQYDSSRDQHWVWHRTINQGNQPATSWQVDYIEPFLSWKGQHFVLAEIHIYSGYVFSSACKTTNSWLIECLIHCYVIPHSIASDQGIHFTTNLATMGQIS